MNNAQIVCLADKGKRRAPHSPSLLWMRLRPAVRRVAEQRLTSPCDTTNTEQFANSVLEAAYVHAVASEASVRNAAASKSASMAAKGAFCVVC